MLEYCPHMSTSEKICAAASFQMRSNKTLTELGLEWAATKTLKNRKGVECIFACRIFSVAVCHIP